MVSPGATRSNRSAAGGSGAARFALKGSRTSRHHWRPPSWHHRLSLVIGAVGEPALAHLLEGPMIALGCRPSCRTFRADLAC